jgi:ABC-type antimicrobial peptide transport system permease subunit
VARSLLPARIATGLGAIGGLGVILAAIGIYGVMAYTMDRRIPEIGVRLALGSTRSQVLTIILTDALKLVVIGLVLGYGLSVLCFPVSWRPV